MKMLVVILSLLVSRYVKISFYNYNVSLGEIYASLIFERLNFVGQMPSWLVVAVLLCPVFVLMLILVYLVHDFSLGYFIFSLFLFFYLTDCRDLTELESTHAGCTTDFIAMHALSAFFTTVFWYFVFGPVAMVLYAACLSFAKVTQNNENNAGLSKLLRQIVDVLEWLPLRFLGLTFALVADFSNVFSVWFSNVFSLPGLNEVYMKKLLDSALACKEGAEIDSRASVGDLVSLMDRCLVVWLVLQFFFWIALFF